MCSGNTFSLPVASLLILFTSILKNRLLSEIKYFILFFLLWIALLMFYLKGHCEIQDPTLYMLSSRSCKLDFHIYVCDSLVIYVCGTLKACEQIPFHSQHSVYFRRGFFLLLLVHCIVCIYLFLGPSFSLTVLSFLLL